jgi:hypothetical protein
MQTRRHHRFSGLILFNWLVVCGSQQLFCADSTSAISRETQVREVLTRWKSMYGDVPFEERYLFQCMVHVHPQPRSVFHVWSDEILSDAIVQNHRMWAARMFRGAMKLAAIEASPRAYYLNGTRTEPSLLLYELNVAGTQIGYVENGQAILLEVTLPQRRLGSSLETTDIAQALRDWIELEAASRDDIVGTFHLPSSVSVGTVFTNRTVAEVGRVREWRDYILGFVTKTGFCIILVKADPQRAQLGLPFDFDWLNRGLFKADGVTLLSPPKELKQ